MTTNLPLYRATDPLACRLILKIHLQPTALRPSDVTA
ncbi:hypothetical protein V6Z12_D13G244800 [Gossypium hirsutum]